MSIESTKQDIAASLIEDFIPERLIKVYPYEFVNADKSKAFVQGNTVSVAAISQSNLDDTEHLLTDDEGYKYFEILPSISTEARLDASSATSVFGQELKEEDTFSATSNFYYQSKFNLLQSGMGNLLPALFVIGEPFNRTKYTRGEQAVFIPTTMMESKDPINDSYLNPEGLYEFTLINLTAIEASFTNARVLLTSHKDIFTNPIVTLEEDFTYETNLGTTISKKKGDAVPGIQVRLEADSLVNRIIAKGKVDGVRTDIDLASSNKIIPFKFTPVLTQDKLTMFADWFDYDTTAPLFMADYFATENTLENVFHLLNTLHTGLDYVKDMIAISYAYATAFSDFIRIDSGGDAGKIDSKATIGSWDNIDGSKGLKVTGIENKDPITVIDGVYEKWLRSHPHLEDSDDSREMKIVLNLLSRYIYSSYCIGKGQNAFNQAYLPWYLEPTDSIGLKKTGDNYQLKDDINYRIRSRWFNADATTLEPLDQISVSDLKLIQTDRKLTIPEVPDTISPITKLPLPGDIDTASSNSLMYMWYIPVKGKNEFQTLFLNTKDQTIDNTGVPIAVSGGYTQEGQKITDPQVYIKEQYLIAHNMDPNFPVPGVHFNSVGSPQTLDSSEYSTRTSRRNIGAGNAVDLLLHNGKVLGTIEVSFGTPSLLYTSEADALNAINSFIETEFGPNYRVTSTDVRRPSQIEINGYIIYGFKYVLIKEKYDGTVLVDSEKITISFKKRDVLFDKPKWKQFLSDIGILNTATETFTLLEERHREISSIEEVTISQVWGNSATLIIKNEEFKIPLFNEDDESIGVQRVIFT